MSNTIAIAVVADVQKATRGLRQVSTEATEMGKGVSRSAGVFKGALGAIGAAAIASKVVDWAKDALDAFGNLGSQTVKLQRVIGGTAEESSRLVAVFKAGGLGADDATKSLGKLSVHLVANDSAAKAMGIAYRDANGHLLPMAQLLPDLADKFASMPNGAEKSALAIKLFGKSGLTLLPTLNRGAAGIKELTEQSDKLGTTLSGADLQATIDNAKAKRQFGEAMEGVSVTIGRFLYPALTKITVFLVQRVIPAVQLGIKWFLENLAPAISTVSAYVTDSLLPAVAGLVAVIVGKVIPVIRAIVGWFAQNHDAAVALGVGIGVLVAGLLVYKTVVGVISIATKAWAAVQAVLNVVMSANPIALVVIAIAALVAGVVYAYLHFQTFRDIVNAVWSGIKTAVSAVVGWFQAYVWPVLRVYIGLVAAYFRTLWAVVQAVWSGISAVIGRYVAIVRGYITAVVAVIRGISAAFGAVYSGVVDKVGALIGFVKSLPGKIANAASGMWDGIKNAFRGAVNWIIAKWNDLSLTIGGMEVPLPFGKSFTIPSVTLSTPNIPYLAKGGIVNRPTLSVIGEAGPEAVIPLSRLGNLGGRTVTYNITVNALDPRQAGSAVVNAIKNYERRNGTRWRAA